MGKEVGVGVGGEIGWEERMTSYFWPSFGKEVTHTQ